MDNLLEIIKQCDNTTIFIIVAVIGMFVEITPIKLSPFSSIIKWIGNKLNGDTNNQLETISLQLETVSGRIDKIEINDMRSQILDFANSCMNKRKHTKEEFEHIIDLHTQYEDIISKKGMTNGRVDLAFRYISDLYTICLNENSFLGS